MNYGVTLLGATVVICHFLRLCGVMGDVADEQEATYARIQQEFFRSSGMDIDDTVLGWLTGDPSLKNRNMVRAAWASEDPGSLETFFEQTPLRTESGATPKSIDREVLCNFRESQITVEDFAERVYEPPKGCTFTDSNNTLVCETVDTVPPLPPKLSLFELNASSIRVLQRRAFGDTEVATMKIHSNGLLCFHPYAFEGVKGLRVLSLSDNNLQYVRPEDFQSMNDTTMIYLEHNNINLLDYPAYYGGGCPANASDVDPVLPSLMYLSLMGNPLKIVSKDYFYALRQSPLAYLGLANCQLLIIQRGAFDYLPNLNTLDLGENPDLMSSLADAFDGAVRIPLKSLSLVCNNLNNLSHVTAALAPVSSTLEILDLTGNLFDTIGDSSFTSQFQSLKSLNFDSCRIRTISPAAFQHLVNLETLVLKRSRLAAVPYTIRSLVNLKHLDLSANVPSLSSRSSIGLPSVEFEIPPNIFKNQTKLKTLTLNNLPVRGLSTEMFTGLDALEVLLIGECEVATVANFTFAPLRNLRTLSLSCNELSRVYDFTFYGLEKLEYLYLEYNRITLPCDPLEDDEDEDVEYSPSNWKSVGPYYPAFSGFLSELPDPDNGSILEPFRYMPELKELRMGRNYIRTISPELFVHLPKLEKVDLTGNFIHSWAIRVIPEGSKIENFTISHNSLGPVSTAMLQDFQAIQNQSRREWSVDFSENPLVCDKSVCEIIRMVNNGTLKVNKWNQGMSHSCVDASIKKYYKLADSIDLICKNKTVGDGDSGVVKTTLAPEELHPPTSKPRVGTSPSQIITSTAVVLTGVLLVGSVLTVGYRKRFHLKYFCFVVRFNVVNLPNLSAAQKKRNIVEQNYEYDIFVSYNHLDRDFIQDHLVPQLEGGFRQVDLEEGGGRPVKICIHERDFQVGVPITENIVDFVDRSRKVVVVVSKNYLQSQWCLYEMNLAYHRLIESGRKSFVVILLEDIPSRLRTKSLNYLLLSRTYLEWPGNEASMSERNTFWKRLSSSLGATDPI